MNYIGSKSKLSSFIFDTVTEVVGSDLSQKVFCDLFAGTGIVGRTFKTQVKEIIANDVETSGGTVSGVTTPGMTIYLANIDGSTTDIQVYWDDVTLIPSAGGTSNTPYGASSGSPQVSVRKATFCVDDSKQ